MNDEQYSQHCRQLYQDYVKTLRQQTEFLPDDDALSVLCAELGDLIEPGAPLLDDAPSLIYRLFSTYPDMAPGFPRQLLWFFGRECLHFMPDDEIELHQTLDEQRLEAAAKGEVINLIDARAKLLKLQ